MGLSILFIILFICTAILAALEMALSSINKLRVKTKVDKNEKAKKVLELIENYDKTITTIIVLNNIINIILPTISTIIFINIFSNNQELGILLSTISLTLLLLMFGEILPKTYGKKNSEKLIFSFVNIIDLIVKIFKPVTFIFIKTTDFVKLRLFKDEEEKYEVEEEILTMIEEDDDLEETEEELIRNAIEFSDIRVEEILQPKSNMVMVDVESSNEEIYKLLVNEKYSRIPIFKDNIDNIIGVIYERDFLRSYIDNNKFDINKIIRDIDFVPDTVKVQKLLPEMQKKHMHMSIVVDEYGTVQGLITVEDIIEELVGEIWDEHDEVIYEFEKINENCYHVLANITIDDFNELFEKNIDIETEDSTLSGYLLEKIQRIPEIDEIIEDDQFTFKILEKTDRKIEKIEVKVKNDL